jgi:hypothetical protein
MPDIKSPASGLERGNDRAEKKLSSDIAILFKTVIPSLLLAAFIGNLVDFAFRDGSITGWSCDTAIALMLWPCCLYLFQLKRVVMQPDGLIVTGCFSSCHIPYTDLETIRQYGGTSGTILVTLVLRRSCRFGRYIRYMAHSYYLGWGRLHPDVESLLDRCRAAKIEKPAFLSPVFLRRLLEFYVPAMRKPPV